MNEATQLGIAAINKNRQSMVESQAINLAERVLSHNRIIASEKEAIRVQQVELAKIQQDVITQESVLGSEMTGTLNINQQTIAKAIAKMNEQRQGQVELRGQAHINRIEQSKATIKQNEECIAKLREELAKLQVDVVDAASVVGQQ